MQRTRDEILSDIELWAKERLATGEQTIYLGSGGNGRMGVLADGRMEGEEQSSGRGDENDRHTISEIKSNNLKKTTASAKTSSARIPSPPPSAHTPIPPAAGIPAPRTTSAATRNPQPEIRSSQTPNPTPQTPAPWLSATDLPTLQSLISSCTKCELHKTRTNFVFGVGNPNAKVMVIGEAPGKDEDEQGEPFVGRAGQLLNKMLAAINFPREEVFIANILKSRPPGNRDPKPEEVAACEPYLWKQIEIIKPKMILCVGRIAGSNLLKTGDESLAKMRGKVFDFMNAKVMVTYHPAALLRNPNWKHGAWEDLKQFRKLYDELVGNREAGS